MSNDMDCLRSLCKVIYDTETLQYIEIGSFDFEGLFMYVPDECVLGVSKKLLYSLYFNIRHELRDIISRKQATATTTATTTTTNSSVMDFTLIALLVTFEHISCINIRKESISGNTDKLHQELRILNIIFSSRLAKQTKSSSLWQHRRWVLEQLSYNYQRFIPLYAGSLHHRTSMNLKTDQLDKTGIVFLELSQVLLAGDRHPTNYYAWSHARWVLDHYNPRTPECIALADLIFQACKTLVSDISRWSFLDYLLTRIGDNVITTKYTDKVQDLDRLVPGHESIKWFLGARQSKTS